MVDMQSCGKQQQHGRLSKAIPVSKAQAFSCGFFEGIFGVCTPLLVSSNSSSSPRARHFGVTNSDHDFLHSNILLIQQEGAEECTDESCESSQVASSGTETPNSYSSLNLLSSNHHSGENSPPLVLETNLAKFDLSKRLPLQELSDDQCIENLLARIRKGVCTKLGLETLLRLVAERKSVKVREALEEEVGSALISLLTSKFSNQCFKHTEPYEQAFASIVKLVHNEDILKRSATPEMLHVVDWILSRGSLDARVNAAVLIQKISSNEELEKAIADRQSFLDGIVKLTLKNEQPNATKLALRTLLALCLLVENRCGAVRAGSVAAIMKILPSASGTTAEKSLAILELLGTTPEGRAAMTDHELVVPVLVNIILKISDRATEYATGALCAICTPDTHQIQEKVAHAGAQTRLLLLLQSHCTPRAKRKALQLLKVLHRFWDQEPRNADSGHTVRIHF
ncbi:unnamed protein product [Calypogeia fissa]